MDAARAVRRKGNTGAHEHGGLTDADLLHLQDTVQFVSLGDYLRRNKSKVRPHSAIYPRAIDPDAAHLHSRSSFRADKASRAIRNDMHCGGEGYKVEEDLFAPPYWGPAILKAHDAMEATPELAILYSWMESVRTKRGCEVHPLDVHFTNGVCMLETMKIVAPDALAQVTGHADNCGVPMANLDQAGKAGRKNIATLCAALERVHWVDPASGVTLDPLPFDTVDVWALGAYVLLAAVIGDRADEFASELHALDSESDGALSSLVENALSTLRSNSRHSPSAGPPRSRARADCTGHGMNEPAQRDSVEEATAWADGQEHRAVAVYEPASPSDDAASTDGGNDSDAMLPELKPVLPAIDAASPRHHDHGVRADLADEVLHLRMLVSQLRGEVEDVRQENREWAERAGSLQRAAEHVQAELAAVRARERAQGEAHAREVARLRAQLVAQTAAVAAAEAAVATAANTAGSMPERRPSAPRLGGPTRIARPTASVADLSPSRLPAPPVAKRQGGRDRAAASTADAPDTRTAAAQVAHGLRASVADKQRENVALRRRVLVAERAAAALQKELDRTQRDAQRSGALSSKSLPR